MKQSKGFTLIEMIIVVAIIGLLSSVVLTGLNKSRQKARDVRRISHILQIQHELETYRTENNEYPSQSTENNINIVLDAPVDPLKDKYQYKSINSKQGYILGACLEQDRPVGIVSTYATSTGLSPTNAGQICDCDDLKSYCVDNPL